MSKISRNSQFCGVPNSCEVGYTKIMYKRNSSYPKSKWGTHESFGTLRIFSKYWVSQQNFWAKKRSVFKWKVHLFFANYLKFDSSTATKKFILDVMMMKLWIFYWSQKLSKTQNSTSKTFKLTKRFLSNR